MDTNTDAIKKRYNRTALYYDWMDFMFKDEVRKQFLEMAKGKVLEVGVGTGKNLPLYPPGCDVTGIDFSPGMLERARKKATRLQLKVDLLEMDAQHMHFPDHTFDTVVATCVFCSVPDPLKGLAEVKRVCKPDGQVLLLEHVRSENPLLGKIMDILNPISLYLVGANINRRTIENVRQSGLRLESTKNLHTNIIKIIIASPK